MPTNIRRKAKPSPKPTAPASEALITSAELSQATGYGLPAISGFNSAGLIRPAKRGFWPAVETLGALVRRLRERGENSGADDRARKNKADADRAEIELREKLGETVLLADAKQFWSDSRIEIRLTIERAEFLNAGQKSKLLARLAALRPKPLPEPS